MTKDENSKKTKTPVIPKNNPEHRTDRTTKDRVGLGNESTRNTPRSRVS